MNGKLPVALAAGFGGISPSLLQLALGLINGGGVTSDKGPGYYVGLALFGVIGGATALVWGEDMPKRAYFLGLGLPGLVNAGVVGATAQSQATLAAPPAVVLSAADPARYAPPAFSLFATPAYAEPQPQQQAPPASRELILKPSAAERAQPAVRYRLERQLTLVLDDVPAGSELIFASPDGAKLERYVLEKGGDKDAHLTFDVPDFATVARLRVGGSESPRLPLQPGDKTTSAYKVDVNTPFWSDFLLALGSQRVRYTFDVERLDSR